MKNNKQIKIQHYVPRVYLKNFTFDKKKKFIYCFDKTNNNIFPPNIINIAGENKFYDVIKDDEQLMEKYMGIFDGKIKAPLNTIIKSKSLKYLLETDKKIICNFLALQELRTLEFRKMLIDGREQFKKKFESYSGTEKVISEINHSLEENNLKTYQNTFILENLHKLSSYILNLKWVILINKTQEYFYTSDHPVSRYNPNNFGPYGNLGLLSKGIQIFFPISPKLLLCVCDPISYIHLEDSISLTELKNLIFYNQFQIKNSTRFIFSFDTNFDFAKKFLKNHPEYSNVNKKRVEVN